MKIKKANKGKFTDYCGGKVTNECISKGKKNPNPTIRKRATFALNARSWKHQKGGQLYKYDFGGFLKRLFGVKDPEEPKLEIVKNYKIKPGDTFYGIANNYKVTPDSLMSLNPGMDIEHINAGEMMGVPQSSDEDIINQVAEYIWEDETTDPNKDFYELENAPEGGVMIGPGLKTLSKEQMAYIKKHNNVVSREVLDGWLKEKINNSVNNLKQYFKKDWNKIPDRFKMGLLDLRHQVGSLGGFPKLLQSIKNNDLETIQKEIKTTWRDPKTNKNILDKRRYNLRLKRYFYKNGGVINYINLFKK